MHRQHVRTHLASRDEFHLAERDEYSLRATARRNKRLFVGRHEKRISTNGELYSRTILSNSCSQLVSWHLNSSTLTGIRFFSSGLSRSAISSKLSVVCRSVAGEPHLGQSLSSRFIRFLGFNHSGIRAKFVYFCIAFLGIWPVKGRDHQVGSWTRLATLGSLG